MSPSGGHAVVKALQDNGVDLVFGIEHPRRRDLPLNVHLLGPIGVQGQDKVLKTKRFGLRHGHLYKGGRSLART